MENEVFLNPEGYIEVVLYGDQTGESFLDVYKRALPLMQKIESEGGPLLGLCDLTRQTGFSLSSDKIAMEYLEKINYKRLAMFGVPHVEVTKGIILAMGKSANTKIFDTREDAVAWLFSDMS